MSTAMAGIPAFCELPPNVNPIPELFEKHTLNLLIGASKVGKTSTMFYCISEYLRSGKMFGYSAPQVTDKCIADNPMLTMHSGQWMRARVGYIAMNKTRSDVLAHARLYSGLEDKYLFPIITASGNHINPGPDDDDLALGAYYRQFPNQPQLLLVDGIHRLVDGNPNDYVVVTSFCNRLREWQKRKDVTIWATVLKAKAKMGEGYSHSADKIMGSALMGESASSLAELEMVDDRPRPSRTTRVFFATPARSPQFTRYLDYNDSGQLWPCETPSTESESWKDQLTQRLAGIEMAKPIETDELYEWGQECGMSPESVKRWIVDRITAGDLERVKKGTYRRPYNT